MSLELKMPRGGAPIANELAALVTIGVNAEELAVATKAANWMGIALYQASEDHASLNEILASMPCILLVDATNCNDETLAELASLLVRGGRKHGGIITIGAPDSEVATHLSIAGLMLRIGTGLMYAELVSALTASLDRIFNSNAIQVASPAPKSNFPLFSPANSTGGDFGRLRRVLGTVIASRAIRAELFPDGLFADPAWDILLSLTMARIEGRPTQASNIGFEAGIPISTALRRVKDLEAAGLVDRWGDPNDRRRDFVQLSTAGLQAFLEYAKKLQAAVASR